MRFDIGADEDNGWPGLTKLIEEMGELQQVIGKLMAMDGHQDHWDGTNLGDRMEDEIADVLAALKFVMQHNAPKVRTPVVEARRNAKLCLFQKWHRLSRRC